MKSLKNKILKVFRTKKTKKLNKKRAEATIVVMKDPLDIDLGNE